MKKNRLSAFIAAALLAGSAACFMPSAEAAVQVNPIPNLRQDFMKGADVSMLPEMEKLGAKFYDVDGREMDCLQILKNHGVNWIRVRIWNDPKAGPGGGGNTDEARAIQLSERAKALGMKVLVDFHYSDWWADPGKQNTPAAWKKDNADQLAKDVYRYTAKVVKDFQAKGVTPDMIQIGNEVKSGMLWPLGKLPSSDGDKVFSNLMREGLKAVRDNDPQHAIKLMVHLPDGGDNAFYQSFFNSLIVNKKVNDFDVIGLSYYPFWHGTLDMLQNNIDDISKRYNKDVVVVETAFGYTNENFDSQKNCYGANEERIGGFRSTVQGQASGLRAVMERLANVPNGRGTGMFYWEPDWYPVAGAGWKTGEGNEWDNLAMFDKNGKALDSLDVFKLVSDTNAQTVVPEVKAVDSCEAKGGVGTAITLPDKVQVTYTDDSARDLAVVWDTPAPVYDAVGSYTVKGMIQGINQPAECKVTVIQKANLVRNGNFEQVNLDGWTITGDKGAVNAVSKAGDSLDKGSMHYWSDKAFSFQATQSFKELKPGRYTLAVSTQGGGGQASYELFVTGDNGRTQKAEIKDVGWNKWQTVTIQDIEIKDGSAVIGVTMKAAPGNWGSLDNFEFYCQE